MAVCGQALFGQQLQSFDSACLQKIGTENEALKASFVALKASLVSGKPALAHVLFLGDRN